MESTILPILTGCQNADQLDSEKCIIKQNQLMYDQSQELYQSVKWVTDSILQCIKMHHENRDSHKSSCSVLRTHHHNGHI